MVCFLGLGDCAESHQEQDSSQFAAPTSSIHHLVNSTVIQSLFANLADAHSGHFSDVKIGLFSVVALLALILLVLALSCYRRRGLRLLPPTHPQRFLNPPVQQGLQNPNNDADLAQALVLNLF